MLAAAVAVDADVLCTDNLKDFPADAMDEVGIRLMSADALLSLLVAEFPDEMLAAHRLVVSRLPGATDASTLAMLRRAGRRTRPTSSCVCTVLTADPFRRADT